MTTEEEEPTQEESEEEELIEEEPILPVQQSFQFTLENWMAAYSQRTETPREERSTVPFISPFKKEEPKIDPMKGGWRFEGKEKPETPRICPKCQWTRRNETSKEPDKTDWCDSCVEGITTLGHDPDKGYRPPTVSKDHDAATLNQSFFE